jgi:hypothetical protein
MLGRNILLFDGVARNQLAGLVADPGDLRTPNISDLFVAVMGNQTGKEQGAAR